VRSSGIKNSLMYVKKLEVITKGLERLKDLRTRAKPGFKPIGVELFRKLL